MTVQSEGIQNTYEDNIFSALMVTADKNIPREDFSRQIRQGNQQDNIVKVFAHGTRLSDAFFQAESFTLQSDFLTHGKHAMIHETIIALTPVRGKIGMNFHFSEAGLFEQ